jgi:putative tricarboxylic transport membrane protein
VAIIIAYAFCWDFLGFVIITPFAIFALMFLLGLRRLPGMIIFAVAATGVIFCAFRFLLGIDMPMGVLYGLF